MGREIMRNRTTSLFVALALAGCAQPSAEDAAARAAAAAQDAAAAAQEAANAGVSQAPSPQPVRTDYTQTFKNNFFLNCSKEMSAGADALPADLSMQVCSCAANSIVASFSEQQLQEFDRDVANSYTSLTPHIETCTQSELPKYMEANPEFLRQYVQKHPELLSQ